MNVSPRLFKENDDVNVSMSFHLVDGTIFKNKLNYFVSHFVVDDKLFEFYFFLLKLCSTE